MFDVRTRFVSASHRTRCCSGRQHLSLCILSALALVSFAVPSVAPAQQPDAPFSIAEALSAPFPSNLVAAPTGNRVAWIRNDRGVRNIWVAEAAQWRSRAVTEHVQDVGQQIVDLQFSPDGRQLFYSLGGSGNVPNPANLPRGPEVGRYVVELSTWERREIPGGGSFALSPDHSSYLITRGDRVLVVSLRGDTTPELLFSPRRGARELAWSPEGSRIAFVSPRGDHSFVGVYDLERDAITWMAPSLDHDQRPVWSPAGDRLAFLRMPNRKDRLPFIAHPESLPWSIHVADPETGRATELWRADEGAGSVFWGVYGPPLIWARDRLVFPWEKTGWTQMWSLVVPPISDESAALGTGAATRGATLLTSGAHEVQSVALSADSTELLLSSNQGDINRRHLWRVPIDGSRPPRAVTEGEGIEWDPAPLTGDAVAFLASGPTTPAHAEILSDGARRMLAPDWPPRSFPEEHMVTPEAVVFPATDGIPIHGQLFSPPARCGRAPHPGLLYFHGGPQRQMLLGFHPREYYHHAYAFNQYMANRCFVVLSVNYRSGLGYGLAFREAEDYGAGGASELRDVIGAGHWLAARPEVDAGRVGLWGASYGGYLTALGLARAPELFAAGVDIHGVHDWNAAIANFVDYNPEARPAVARVAWESSPLYDLSRWEDPVLLIHGDDDRNVPFSQSVDLAEALRQRGVRVEQVVFPDEVHDILLWQNWVRAFNAASEFLVETLGR